MEKILENPAEDRFRRLKCANKKIAEVVVEPPGAVAILHSGRYTRRCAH
jgi:hypothetical protein